MASDGGGAAAGVPRAVMSKADLAEDAKMAFETSKDVDVMASFEAMGLREDLLRGIYSYGFEKPSAIQQRAIMPIVKGRDLIAQSQSGTGKTAVFSIGILQSIDLTATETQALVLSPTRELAEQTQKVILALGDYMNVKCHACIGGKSISEDIRRLEHGVQVVSGTPGRVFDMIKRKALQTRGIKMLVLDESDEMLNKGFKEQVGSICSGPRCQMGLLAGGGVAAIGDPYALVAHCAPTLQIYDIYRYLPPTTQVVLLSATLPVEVLDMTRKFMNTPLKVRTSSLCDCQWDAGGACLSGR